MTRNKSGLSTLVGAVFVILVLAVGLGAFIHALNQQDLYAQVATQRTQADWDRLNEELDATKVAIAAGKFNVTLMNEGKLPIKVDSLWITNQTANPKWHQKFDFIPAKEIGPSKTITNIGQDLSLSALDSKSYVLKFVTERGNAASIKSISVAEADLKLSLFLMPRTITSGENVTILFSVKNNQLDADSIHKINPVMDYSVCIPNCNGVTITPKSTPTQLDSLPRDSTALFKWVYKIEAPSNTIVRFAGSIQNGKPGNFVSDDLTIKLADFAGSAGKITIDFSSIRWTKNGEANWNSSLAVPVSQPTIWKVNMTNHDVNTFYIGADSSFLIQKASSAQTVVWYVIKSYACNPTCTVTAYSPNYSIAIASSETKTIYFAANAAGSANVASTAGTTDLWTGYILMFGGFGSAQPTKDTYGQNLPFIGIKTV